MEVSIVAPTKTEAIIRFILVFITIQSFFKSVNFKIFKFSVLGLPEDLQSLDNPVSFLVKLA
jgi:hypothetical protein